VFGLERKKMVEEQIALRGVRNRRVLKIGTGSGFREEPLISVRFVPRVPGKKWTGGQRRILAWAGLSTGYGLRMTAEVLETDNKK